jgi:hypothetical protein
MTHGSAEAHLSLEVRSRAKGHMAAPEPTSIGRRCLEPYDMWQHWSPSQQGGEVRSYGAHGNAKAHLPGDEIRSHRIHDSTGAHLSKEARSGAIGRVIACGCMSCYLS